MRILALKTLLARNPAMEKIFANISWLLADKIVRVGVGFVITIWLARYLGPADFGLLNYVLAFVALFASVSSLGLGGVVVRDLVRKAEPPETTLGTAFALQLAGGLLASLSASVAIIWLSPGSPEIQLMVVIVSLGLVFKSSEIVTYWFESRVQSKYTVWINIVAILLVSIAKVILILTESELLGFVWLALLESALLAAGWLWIYRRQGGNFGTWRLRLARAKLMLSDSWPLILSGLAIIVYMRIDQIMLGNISGVAAVGVYSAALQISEVWYMIPMIICGSMFPRIVEAKDMGPSEYRRNIQTLLNLLATMALAIAIVVTLVADPLIVFLYGEGFAEAGTVLKIHVWACLFVFLGVVGNRWYLVESLQRLSLYWTIVGAVVNVLLNLILIPGYGAVGAAISTVASYALAAYLLDATTRSTYYIFQAKSRALLLPFYSIWPKRRAY